MAVHVSAGLLILHDLGIIHGDIAARNALAKSNYDTAVADFGLSRQLPDGKDQGTFPDGEGCPVLSSSPETMTRRAFSKKTDVYMFGVFLWEIFARAQPYCDSQVAQQCAHENKWGKFREEVCSGLRPTIPPDWPPHLTRLITKCWARLPEDRPTMKVVNQDLDDLKADISRSKLDLPSFFKYEHDKIEESKTLILGSGATLLGSAFGTTLATKLATF